MLKKILVFTILALLSFQSFAFAADTSGEVVFRDAMYGAIIGGLLGGAIYLMDDKDVGAKIGAGVAIGTIGGLVFGVMETRGVVGIEKGKVRVNVPTPVVQKRGDSHLYSISALKVNF
jgi:hypothetical protein